MNPTQRFLSDHGLAPAAIDAEALLAAFDAEMTRGLAGAAGALPMIPAFVTIDRPVPPDKPAAVIDAGGTNLRVALVRFDANGRPHISNYTRTRMPGTQAEVTADTFFDALADCIAPLAREASAVGFCFSYPAEITPDLDARLLCWTKQIRAPAVVGTMVGSGLRRQLAQRGADRPVVVLNDTVATLLAGKSAGIARHYASYVGLILGTGTNTAYVESHASIRKRRDLDPGGAMAINVESGSFARAPRSRFDEAFDATTSDAGSYPFEKMIAGAYLGGLGTTVLRAAAEAGLFSPAAAAGLRACPVLANKEFDDFCHNPQRPPPALAAVPFTEDDRRAVLAIGEQVFGRAALFAAVNIAAAVIRTGAGTDPLRPVAVTIDGATYYRTVAVPFASLVQEHLRRLLAPRGLHVELLHVEEAPLIGAAVAGLTTLW